MGRLSQGIARCESCIRESIYPGGVEAITFSCLKGCDILSHGFHTLGFHFPVIRQVSVREILMVTATTIPKGMLLGDASISLFSA